MGYQSKKNKCVLLKREGGNIACCAATVEECFSMTCSVEKWIQKPVEFLKSKYEDVAVEMGNEIGLTGM